MIFYFSGTGNTRWAAEELAKYTGDEHLLFIPDELKGECKYELAEGERLGFCFPVHGWQPPRIVKRFIEKMQLKDPEKTYAYALCTCGDSVGRAMAIFRKRLRKKGITLQMTTTFVMPESYVCLPFMHTDTPEREAAKLGRADREMICFRDFVRDRVDDFDYIKRGALPFTFSHVIGAFFNRFMVNDSKFTVDADVCTHCGRCQRECPVDNIVTADGLPSWKHDSSCTCCLSCYHHCPVHAINYGRITRKRGQYYFGHR